MAENGGFGETWVKLGNRRNFGALNSRFFAVYLQESAEIAQTWTLKNKSSGTVAQFYLDMMKGSKPLALKLLSTVMASDRF